MNNSSLTNIFMVLGLILIPVIGLSLTFNNYTIPQSSLDPQLFIDSVNAQPLFWNGSSQQGSSNNSQYTYFQLNISLKLVFHRSQTITMSGLGLCSFHAKLVNSNYWQIAFIQNFMCMIPKAINFHAGTYFFNIVENIEPINTNTTINYSSPIKLVTYSLDSTNLSIQSQVYSFNLSSSGMLLTIESIQLNNITNLGNGSEYQVTAKLDFFTSKGFNLTYVCNSPFILELVNSSSINLTEVTCNYMMNHYIPAGDSPYYLMYYLINSSTSTLNSISNLPPTLIFQASSSQLHLLSTIYNLNTG